jgi:hypothetical protein
MSDDAIRVALAKRAEAEERIKKLERNIKRCKDQIIEINSFIRAWEKFSGRSVDALQGAKPLSDKGEFVANVAAQSPRMVPVNSRKEEVAEAARQILAEAGRPLPRSELFQEIIKRGLTIVGKDPEMILSTMLWRTRNDSGIARLKSGKGYCLQADADPAETDDSHDDAGEDDEG